MSGPQSKQRPSFWTQEVLDSRLAMVFISIVVSTLVFLLSFLSDQLWINQAIGERFMLSADAGVAALCGLLIFLVLNNARLRHRRLLQRLEIIGNMNHHIRNALHQIQLSAHVTNNRELVASIQEAISRIEWTLREVLPQTAFTDASPKNSHPPDIETGD